MRQSIISQTERLLIRPFEMSDVTAACRILCDPEVMKFSSGVKTPDDVKRWTENRIDEYSQLGFGIWAIVLKKTNRMIGYCGLSEFPDIEGQEEIEIGFRFEPCFWSQGYATEAAIAVRDYAFDMLSLTRIIALVDPGNTASIRVIEKIGMTYEKDVMLPDYDYPDRLYALHPQRGEQ
ncbi:GNAT family N-acetyltransferase [Gimesia aquarii]|nr:GNAT family N-acetyltransferase [Gimesia aquarii]